MMDAMDPPNPDPEPPNEPIPPNPATGTIPWAKFQDDDNQALVSLSDVVVTLADVVIMAGEDRYDGFWVKQNAERTPGIQVAVETMVEPILRSAGGRLTITGTMHTDNDGQRFVLVTDTVGLRVLVVGEALRLESPLPSSFWMDDSSAVGTAGLPLLIIGTGCPHPVAMFK